jgi:hypothetical protein
MKIRRSGSRPYSFSSLVPVALVGAALLLVTAGCQADPDATTHHGLPDGGQRRDAQPGEPDAELDPADATSPPDPDTSPPPEPDAETPPGADAADDAAALPVPDAAQDAGAPPPLDAAVPPVGDGIRVALEVANDVPESIFVQVNDALGQPAWVRLAHEGVEYFLNERCDVPRCDAPGEGVCGAAEPRVRDITGGTNAGVHALQWDGTVSRLSADGACETRGPAPAGAWKATVCWSLSATFSGPGDAAISRPGEVGPTQCNDVPFTLPGDTEVVLRLSGG